MTETTPHTEVSPEPVASVSPEKLTQKKLSLKEKARRFFVFCTAVSVFGTFAYLELQRDRNPLTTMSQSEQNSFYPTVHTIQQQYGDGFNRMIYLFQSQLDPQGQNENWSELLIPELFTLRMAEIEAQPQKAESVFDNLDQFGADVVDLARRFEVDTPQDIDTITRQLAVYEMGLTQKEETVFTAAALEDKPRIQELLYPEES